MITPDRPVPTRRRLRMLIPLWGEAYYRKWLEIAAPALLAPGNLPGIRDRADFELVFLCKADDIDYLARQPAIRELSRDIAIKTVTIDEFFPVEGQTGYGVPLTLAYAKGIRDLGEEGIGTYVILMNADFVVSTGSLSHLVDLLDQGFHIVAAPSIRVIEHLAAPQLRDRLSQEGAARAYAPRAMVTLAQRFIHHTVTARTLNELHPVATYRYHELFWRVSDTCLAGRYFLLMPFCFEIRRQIETVIGPVDYTCIEQCCPGGRYTVAGDSDRLLLLELQHRDCEAELLDLVPNFSSVSEALDFHVPRIAAEATLWTNAEHRRAFAHTVLFHSDELPADIDARLADFTAQIDRITSQLPAPVADRGHYHWLGALHAYRAVMHAKGLPIYPTLIADDANRWVVALSPVRPETFIASAEQPPTAPPCALADVLGGAATVITLDYLAVEAAPFCKGARFFAAAVSDAHSLDLDMTFDLPANATPGVGITCFYLLVDSVPHVPKFMAICDRLLAAGRRVVFAFRTLPQTPFTFRQQSWLLSMLHSLFPAATYRIKLETVPATEGAPAISRPAALSTEPCLGFIVDLEPTATAAPTHAAAPPLAKTTDRRDVATLFETLYQRSTASGQEAFVVDQVLERLVKPQHHGMFWGDRLLTLDKSAAFRDDPAFRAAMARTGRETGANQYASPDGIAWRYHVLVWAARECLKLRGDFVECGVYRGDMSWMISELVDLAGAAKTFYLYDTFSGFDARYSSPGDFPDAPQFFAFADREYKAPGIEDAVRRRFADKPYVVVSKGSVPDVLRTVAPSTIAFLHLDMNSPAPERGALDILFDRIVPGGMAIFDDYGWRIHREQKRAADEFMAARGHAIVELPTGQGLAIKR